MEKMNKKGSGDFFWIIIIVIILSYIYWPNDYAFLEKEYYWRDTPINYYFSESYPCEGLRKSQVLESFNIIEKETDNIVNFTEGINGPGIEISCYDEYMTEEAAAFGGIENYEGDNEIISGFVELFRQDSVNFYTCENYPSTALHEILHSMGIDHIDSRRSIMNSMGDEDCPEIDKEIVNCLKYIYSKGQENYTCERIPFLQ